MSSKWRRFEVLLPLQFNDGRDVPTEWLVVRAAISSDLLDGALTYVGIRRRHRTCAIFTIVERSMVL